MAINLPWTVPYACAAVALGAIIRVGVSIFIGPDLHSQFSNGLRRHIAWEDDDLFPLFESRMELPGGPTAMMRGDHLLIKDCLAKIESSMGGDTAEWEMELATALCPHNMKEEKILYPWIDQAVPQSDRQKALEKMRMESACSQVTNSART